MSPVLVTWRRTVGQSRSLFATVLAVAGFLAAAGTMFAFALQAADGDRVALTGLWSSSVAMVLPLLAAFLSMDIWSEDRRTGRIDMLLSAPVRERNFVLGKFLGVWSLAAASLLLFLVESLVLLRLLAPSALAGVSLAGFLPSLLILFVQTATWCAAGVMFSAFFTHGSAAFCATTVFSVVLPRGAWAATLAWLGESRVSFGEMPFDAHVADCSAGVISVGILASYLLASVMMLFVNSKLVASFRLPGRGSRTARLSTALTIFLAVAFSVTGVRFLSRFDTTIDLAVGGASASFSSRTRNLLADSSGDVVATCFLSRNDPRFRSVGQMLRSLKRQSESLGGARFALRFVDIRWDLAAAERLVRSGVGDASLLFERGGRRVAMPLSEGFGERAVASALRRLMTPVHRRTVCWTVGHGEASPADYGTFGMSDIARDVVREGFQNADIDLSADKAVPGDCALIVVAGARQDFSRSELSRLDAYLRDGGRLLLFLGTASGGGLESLLSSWGVRSEVRPLAGARTLTGSDVIVSEFAEHPVSTPLQGSRIVLERPVAFEPTAAVEAGVGADRIGFTSVARLGTASLVVSVERGVGAGGDLALRPTRIVVVGDATFAMNGPLSTRGNANRDFFLNCISYLSGTDSSGSSGAESDQLVSGLDRDGWLKLVLALAAVVPSVVFLLLLIGWFRRRMAR